jgi:transposase-like protein
MRTRRRTRGVLPPHRRVDETLFKIGGRWRYAFRATDLNSQIVHVLLIE